MELKDIGFWLIIIVFYIWPMIYCWQIFWKYRNWFYLFFAVVPIINLGFVGTHLDNLEEKRREEERDAEGQAKVLANPEVYRVHITLNTGEILKSYTFKSHYSGGRFYGFVSGHQSAEHLVNRIVARGCYEVGDTKHPYHTINEMNIVEEK